MDRVFWPRTENDVFFATYSVGFQFLENVFQYQRHFWEENARMWKETVCSRLKKDDTGHREVRPVVLNQWIATQGCAKAVVDTDTIVFHKGENCS